MLSRFHKKDKIINKEEKQFIIFKVGQEQFGVDVRQAREIITVDELTLVPNAPDFVLGVIDLRGEVIPIIDLKKRLLLNEDVKNQEEKIIIIELNDSLIGIKVDDVNELIRLNIDDIAEPPEIIQGINRDYLSGVGKLESGLLILLDLKKILSDKEIKEVNKINID